MPFRKPRTAESLLDIRNAIASYGGDDPWLKKAATALANGSPTSAALA